ncbi:MAG TPA: type IV pilus twitching motility protein PilT [Fimbriimonadales bacterium]|nr:type IV pilus twitching motility protein PilT [Fimbriimonadales bacterium]
MPGGRIDDLLHRTVALGGSDLHIKAGSKPYVRVHGDLICLEDEEPFTPDSSKAEIFSLLAESQRRKFEKDLELDFAYEIPGFARFRGNVYRQRGCVQAAFRVIPSKIQTFEELGVPRVVESFCERPRGFVLMTGPAGSGKSTTQAACIDYINHKFASHIVTVEDPIEFIHTEDKALIRQREIENDTLSFANALKYVLRQDPDVILVGEMRDLETIHLAITAAETGQLVFGTLHTADAVQTIDRIIDVFPIHQQQQIRMQLSVNLVGVISQTLVRRADGQGRVAAFEVLTGVGAVRNLIRENKTYQIYSILQTGTRMGMMTLDQSLANLVKKKVVTYDDALAKAKDRSEFERIVNMK